jgi:hypothetical protein
MPWLDSRCQPASRLAERVGVVDPDHGLCGWLPGCLLYGIPACTCSVIRREDGLWITSPRPCPSSATAACLRNMSGPAMITSGAGHRGSERADARWQADRTAGATAPTSESGATAGQSMPTVTTQQDQNTGEDTESVRQRRLPHPLTINAGSSRGAKKSRYARTTPPEPPGRRWIAPR